MARRRGLDGELLPAFLLHGPQNCLQPSPLLEGIECGPPFSQGENSRDKFLRLDDPVGHQTECARPRRGHMCIASRDEEFFIAELVEFPGDGLSEEANLSILSAATYQIEQSLSCGSRSGALIDNISSHTLRQIVDH